MKASSLTRASAHLRSAVLVLVGFSLADSLLFSKHLAMSKPALRRCSAQILLPDVKLSIGICAATAKQTRGEHETPSTPNLTVTKRRRPAPGSATRKGRAVVPFTSPEAKRLSRPPVVTPSAENVVTLSNPVVPSETETTLTTTTTCGANNTSRIQRDDEFQNLHVPPAELRPSATLTTGQCFHWKVVVACDSSSSSSSSSATDKDVVAVVVPWPTTSTIAVAAKRKKATRSSAWGSHNATEWIGNLRVPVTGESVVILLRETPDSVWYRTLYAPVSLDVRSFLCSYFQLPTNHWQNSFANPPTASLKDLYGEWSTQCDRLRRIALCIPGVRIIDQDPWECLVSFLCSSNNNIPRIAKILNAIRRHYGEPLLTSTPSIYLGEGKQIAGAEDDDYHDRFHYSFPSLEQLQRQATEADLRSKCGMGYRAKYLIETMQTLTDLGGEMYLQELRRIRDPILVQNKLIQFNGVGQKVADCVALFSLQQSDAIPVDVHVWNIARRDYGAEELIIKTTKSLTPTIYRQIGDLFRSRFPLRSGWAHSLLFVAELPSFRQALPDDLVEEMEQVRIKVVYCYVSSRAKLHHLHI